MDGTLHEFFQEVYEITRQIPRGKVLTYGQIAVLAGRPRHARWVGRALAQVPAGKKLPCHRVVNSAGKPLPGGRNNGSCWKRKRDFRANGRVDMKKHLWGILSADGR